MNMIPQPIEEAPAAPQLFQLRLPLSESLQDLGVIDLVVVFYSRMVSAYVRTDDNVLGAGFTVVATSAGIDSERAIELATERAVRTAMKARERRQFAEEQVARAISP